MITTAWRTPIGRATSDSIVVQVLEGIDLSTRDVTVEVYEGLDAVRQTVNALVERGA